jgi:hypothetical protein
MPLREIQQDLQRYLLAEPSGVLDAIVDAPPLSAADRLGIYRNAYRVRLIDALHDTYPVLHALLGDDMFFALGESFVAAQPSEFRSIRWYGRQLQEFMAQHSPYDEQPILSEVALLEWTLSEVFDAADAPAITRAALADVPPEAWEDLRFEFHPSLRRLRLSWNTTAVWQAMTREESPPDPTPSEAPVEFVLWRQDLKNYFRSLTPAEFTALDAALAGRSFGELCADMSEWLPDEEIPLTAANFLNTWVNGGLIVALG